MSFIRRGFECYIWRSYKKGRRDKYRSLGQQICWCWVHSGFSLRYSLLTDRQWILVTKFSVACLTSNSWCKICCCLANNGFPLWDLLFPGCYQILVARFIVAWSIMDYYCRIHCYPILGFIIVEPTTNSCCKVFYFQENSFDNLFNVYWI